MMAISFVAVLTMWSSSSFAQSSNQLFQAEVDTTYDVDDDNQVSVNHNFVVSNQRDLDIGQQFVVSALGYSISDLQGSFQDGIAMEPVISDSSIVFDVGSSFLGTNGQWSFNLSYKADIYDEAPKVEAFYFPATVVDSGEVARDFVNLILPSSNDMQAVGREVVSKRTVLGDNILTFESFSKNDSRSIVLSPDRQVFEFSSINDNSLLSADTSTQKTYVESSGDGASNSLDDNFNIRTSSRSSGYMSVDVLNYDLSKADGSDTNAQGFDASLLSTAGQWSKFKAIAVEDVAASAVSIIRSALILADEPDNFKNTGNFVATMRANQIPAVMVIGDSYGSSSGVLSSPVDYYWAEVFVEGVGWVQVDPSSTDPTGMIGWSNPLLVSKAVWGRSAQLPELDNLIDSEEYSPTPINSLAGVDITQEYNIELKRNVIIPFLFSIDEVIVTSPQGYVSDHNAAKYSDRIVQLGSMAPLSTVSKKRLSIATQSPDSIEYGIYLPSNSDLRSSDFSSVKSGTVSTSYLLLTVTLFIIFTVGSLLFIIIRRGSRPAQQKREFIHPLSKS